MSNVNWILRGFLLVMLIAFLVAFALMGHAASVPGVDAAALLKRSDTYRNGWPAFITRVKITNYESGKPDEEKLYEVSQKGTDRTYVEFLSPRTFDFGIEEERVVCYLLSTYFCNHDVSPSVNQTKGFIRR